MTDDAVPTPPIPPQIAQLLEQMQGFPPPTVAYGNTPGNAIVAKCGQEIEGQSIYALIIDSPQGRNITFWRHDDLAGLRDRISEQLGVGLTIADARDLQTLRDAGPFEGQL